MYLKERLTRLISAAREEERAWRDTLPLEKRNEHGAADAWAPKDILAHLTAWKAHTLQRIQCALDGSDSPPIEDTDAANADIHALYTERFWEDIESEADALESEILRRLQLLDEAALIDKERFAWTRGRPLWQLISGDFSHALLHLSEQYHKIGDRKSGSRLVLRMSKDVADLSDEPVWQGTVNYNLACYYALDGQPEKAVQTLKKALELNPGLLDWSQQDTDLDSLRARADYQAVYN